MVFIPPIILFTFTIIYGKFIPPIYRKWHQFIPPIYGQFGDDPVAPRNVPGGVDLPDLHHL
jgi:hypothetical protein